jgi:NTE family protein
VPQTGKHEAVVISGGAARFYFELGVLDVLVREHQIDPFAFLGVSAGALMSPIIGQAERAKGQPELVNMLNGLEKIAFSVKSWRDVYERRLLPFDIPGQLDELTALAFAPSMYKLGPMSRLIEESVSLDRLKNSGRRVQVGAVSLESGAYRSVGPEDPNFKLYMRASSVMPLIFDPVVINNEHHVDGGLINVTPLSDLFDLCDEEGVTEVKIHVILATRRGAAVEKKSTWSSVDILQRTIDIMVDEIFKNDIEVAKLRNNEEGKVKAEFLIYEPGPEGSGIDPMQFEPPAMQLAFERGQAIARAIGK